MEDQCIRVLGWYLIGAVIAFITYYQLYLKSVNINRPYWTPHCTRLSFGQTLIVLIATAFWPLAWVILLPVLFH